MEKEMSHGRIPAPYSGNLAEHYDADTIRRFTDEQYQTRKRLFQERDDAYTAAEKMFNARGAHSPHMGRLSFDEVVTIWNPLGPLVEAYRRLDAEIGRLDQPEERLIG